MRTLLTAIFIAFVALTSSAYQVTGKVTYGGEPLGHASIRVLGSTYGVISNGKGNYYIELSSGTHTLICEYVGMKAMKKEIVVNRNMTVDFELSENEEILNTLVIKSGDEDLPIQLFVKPSSEKKNCIKTSRLIAVTFILRHPLKRKISKNRTPLTQK